ncbi:MAG: hypothetical protein Q8K71_13950 [Polaromonas sp.]|nr:hypothetical protein [Polaromonas sp.]
MTELVIPVAEELSTRELEQVRATLSHLAPVLVDRLKAHKAEQVKNLVRILVGTVVPKAMDLRRARMNVTAIKTIYRGTDWLTAAEVGVSLGQFDGSTPVNPAAAANRWRRHGEIFAIRYEGKNRYPRYAFGADWRPLPAIQKVLQLFPRIDPWRLAAWFESSSSYLGGKRPREIILQGGDLEVIAAAHDYHVQMRR